VLPCCELQLGGELEGSDKIVTFACCGYNTEHLGTQYENSPLECFTESVLIVWTLGWRLVSNLSLSIVIPTATMYNYLHSTEPTTTTTLPHNCFISDDSLEKLLISSSISTLIAICVRVVLSPEWTNHPGSGK
jgi:hypothetical protein